MKWIFCRYPGLRAGSNKLRLSLLIVAACLSTTNVVAEPVTWLLSGVTFDSQGSGNVTGSFVFNADTAVYSDVHLVASSYGSTTNVDTIDSNSSELLTTSGAGNVTGNLATWLFFGAPLTDAGGKVQFLLSFEGHCLQSPCSLISTSASGDTGSVIGSPLI